MPVRSYIGIQFPWARGVTLSMYLRKVERHYKEMVYTHYLLVESVHTPRGPRQRTICSLGDLKPKPALEWLALFQHAVEALKGATKKPLANGSQELLRGA